MQGGKEKEEYSDDETSSPRGVLEDAPVSSSSSSQDICVSTSNSCSTSDKFSSIAQKLLARDSYALQFKSMIDMFKKKSVPKLSTIPMLAAASYDISRRTLKWKLARIRSAEDGIDIQALPFAKPSWKNFGYADVAAATNNFSPENLIGSGGNADVYKGFLSDGQVVAVKRLVKKENEEEERTADFLTELGIIAHIDHPNAAHLIGFGVDGGLHLVLQFSPHGSLASLLFSSTQCLEWNIRFKVAVGVAEGLQYLHHGCQRRIIHRDITASNILLTHDFEAQISDFGLAKWLPEKWEHHVVFPIEGTVGYLAPEYFMHGIVDEKTDVFAYGVLLLELITGRRAVDSSRQSLVIWAKSLLETNNVKELADPRLGEAYDPTEIKRAMFTASLCIHQKPSKRPDMNRAVQLLKGENVMIEMKQKSMAPRSLMLDACDLEGYTSSNYLNDLSRHRQLVLE